jgi:hypothetical protein
MEANLPARFKKIFFRADSGFFSGELFDLLENYGWTYLVKVKLSNLQWLMQNQVWKTVKSNSELSFCEFEHKCKDWSKSRTFKAVRILVGYEEQIFFDKKNKIPIYQYFCYCTNLEKTPKEVHSCYKQRSESETWIEQIKSQLEAGRTLTDDFHANDILWQLAVFAYNLSLMARDGIAKNYREEHRTFFRWFINVPGKLVSSGRRLKCKIYKHYYFKNRWLEQEQLLLA